MTSAGISNNKIPKINPINTLTRTLKLAPPHLLVTNEEIVGTINDSSTADKGLCTISEVLRNFQPCTEKLCTPSGKCKVSKFAGTCCSPRYTLAEKVKFYKNSKCREFTHPRVERRQKLRTIALSRSGF